VARERLAVAVALGAAARILNSGRYHTAGHLLRCSKNRRPVRVEIAGPVILILE
jgi:hypothetical protein